jgi:hypothetical protein
MEPKIIPASARARDYGPDAKRFILSALGGSWPSNYVLAASARDAETFWRELNGFQMGGLLERLKVKVVELED